MDLKIDPEFEQKIPPLTDEEFSLLEENILSDGEIRDPLVVWNGFILDGHNRYRIHKKHPDIPMTTREIKLPDRLAAIIWICKNQLGRRNLTPAQRQYLIGKQYHAVLEEQDEETQERDENGRFYRGTQNRYDGEKPPEKARDKVARENNTTGSFVQRAGDFAKGVDAAEEVVPGIREEILTGAIRPSAKAVSEVAKAGSAERRKLVEKLREPRTKYQEKREIPDTDEDEFSKINRRTGKTRERAAPTKKEILAISEGMLHSDGVAAATEEDVIFEMRNALDDMIWRWNNVGKVYTGLIGYRNVQKQIKGLATKGITFLREVKKGELWNEER